MRVLLASTRSAGHFGPLVPFARACERAGHEVRVAAPRSAAVLVRNAGLRHAPHADPSEAALAPVWQRVRAAPSREEANRIVMEEIFAGEHARSALPGMHATMRAWRPDVVLRETGEFASLLLAEHLGIPHLHVSIFLAAAGEIDQRAFAAGIERLREEAGLGAGPLSEPVLGAPYLTLAPRVLEDPDMMPPAGTRRYRASGPAPHAVPDPDQAPLVYVSFGSVAAGAGYFPGLYRAAIDELAGLDARVLITVGNEVDPADLGPLPPGVRAERWVPQAEVMTQAAVMVGHGGSGSTLAAMAAGVPLALIPLFADQEPNARRVAELGAGLALDGTDGLREAVETLLRDPVLRRGARAVAAEIAALPPIDDVVELLAGAARDGRPAEVSRAAAAR